MVKRRLHVALVGRAFMGKAHSNAWSQMNRFFEAPVEAVLHTICAKHREALEPFAAKWAWANVSTDWKAVCRDPAIDLVDVGVPNYLHAPIAIAALRAGKHVACEKPLAGSLAEARRMRDAARAAKGKTFVWYNYRGVPAVAHAHNLVKAGRIGKIRHVRAVYLQGWADESVPLAWRFDGKLAGSGSHGDLNAHIIDMTRFVTGEEITEISGAIAETFIKTRHKLVGPAAGGIAEGLKKSSARGRVTVDDAVLFLARFSGGAVASFEAARQATGNLNKSGFEINGTKGSLRYSFERLAELEYFDATADAAVRGWTTINCSNHAAHPYVSAWWPEAHPIGYEHTFVNLAYSMALVLGGRRPVTPIADFEDAYQTQRVLEAAMIAAKGKRCVKLAEVR